MICICRNSITTFNTHLWVSLLKDGFCCQLNAPWNKWSRSWCSPLRTCVLATPGYRLSLVIRCHQCQSQRGFNGTTGRAGMDHFGASQESVSRNWNLMMASKNGKGCHLDCVCCIFFWSLINLISVHPARSKSSIFR